ncbi:MAG: tetratricopeptide repeat protein [Muribaculaceae bacterium]|nr:tetratricopeptide repeat protein [Muribaculaceae bacterium]
MRLNKIKSNLIMVLVATVLAMGVSMPIAASDKGPKMTKQERVCLRKGNKLYEKKRYAEAEVEYRKALQSNPSSEKAQFNLATALMRQGSVTSQENDDKNPMKQAEGILTNLAKGAQDKNLRGKASYDLGNIAYGRQQYDQAVEFYKHALRCNPDDDQARHNLRLAQLKKQQQDKDKNNKDKNQDNKDQNQDQDKNKDQNQDQNKDQNKDNQDQNKDKQNQDQQKQNQDQQNQDQQKQQQGGMSQQNAEQVLKAMQDRERATQQRINAQQAQQQRHERQRTNKKW